MKEPHRQRITGFENFKRQIQGLIAVIFLVLSTMLFFVPILFLGVAKLFPNKRWRVLMTRWIDTICEGWCSINNFYIDKALKLQLEIEGLEKLRLCKDDWYLVIANHQSWLDIVLLQRIFNRSIPMLKFFIKDQLKWVPLLGFAWWAMGSPFMKRYSKEQLLKYPHKKGKDLEATKKALTWFKESPSSIMNFIEGTRFTQAKKSAQHSNYEYLLKPKAGGVAFVISSMGDKIQHILDVSLVYSEKRPSLWGFLCHRLSHVRVYIRAIPIPQQFIDQGNYVLEDNHPLQIEFRQWINDVWREKDAIIGRLNKEMDTLKPCLV